MFHLSIFTGSAGTPHPIYKTEVPINLKRGLLEETPSPLETAAFLLALAVGQVLSAHTWRL